jgi:HK97 family phage major capsid protein
VNTDEGEREARDAGISRKGTMVSEKAFRKEYRDFTATGGSSGDQGGNTIVTNKGGLLDSLFDENVLAASGATVLTGLVGNLDLPRIVAGTKPAKKAENAQSDEYTATTALLSLTPKRLPTVLEVSSQLLKQTSPSIDAFLQNHIRNNLLNVMEIAHINGGGTSEPTGILSGYDSTNNRVHAGGATVVGTNANGAAPVYNDFVRLASKVQIANALRGSLAYLINGKVEFVGKTTARIASTDSMTIIDDRAPGRINGFGYKLTNAAPSTLTKGASGAVLSAAIFGNFADYVIAQWGGIEFLVNPYTKDDLGLTRINAVVFYDGGVVRPASFAACVDMVAAV